VALQRCSLLFCIHSFRNANTGFDVFILCVVADIKSEMKQSIRWLRAKIGHLAVLNYVIDGDLLSSYMPPGLEMDLWQGRSFVSIVVFLFRQPRILGIPVPCCRDFEQVNLRFYARRSTGAGIRQGIVFVREIVPERLIALVARHCFHEKYVRRPMTHNIAFSEADGKSSINVDYGWYDNGRCDSIQVEAGDDATLPEPQSQEAFFIERYWGYTSHPNGSCLEYRFEHPRWKVRPASARALTRGQAAVFGPGFRKYLFGPPHSAYMTNGSEVSLFFPNALKQKDSSY
jgi:hypothetical protein